MRSQQENHRKTLLLAQFGILLAIEFVICFFLGGAIPIGSLAATLSHIPVIITAILLGPSAGAFMGFFFGLFSCYIFTVILPGPFSFVFTPFYTMGDVHGNIWSLVICFVPRILIGVIAGYSFRFLKKCFTDKKSWLAYVLSGALGSLTNTVLVLGGIYVFFGQPYATLMGKAYSALLGILGGVVLTNGIPEAALGALCAYGVCRPLSRVIHQKT